MALVKVLSGGVYRYRPAGTGETGGTSVGTSGSMTPQEFESVRRLLAYIETSLTTWVQWATFSRNGPALWGQVATRFDMFLQVLFQQGSLQGTTPEQAYFVRCDETTMTAADLQSGRLIVLVGVAALKPAEFVVIEIGADVQGGGASGAGAGAISTKRRFSGGWHG